MKRLLFCSAGVAVLFSGVAIYLAVSIDDGGGENAGAMVGAVGDGAESRSDSAAYRTEGVIDEAGPRFSDERDDAVSKDAAGTSGESRVAERRELTIRGIPIEESEAEVAARMEEMRSRPSHSLAAQFRAFQAKGRIAAETTAIRGHNSDLAKQERRGGGAAYGNASSGSVVEKAENGAAPMAEAIEGDELPASPVTKRMAQWPVVMLPADPEIPLTQIQAEEWGKLRDDFVEDIGGPAQDAQDPNYRERWDAAQRFSDDMFRAKYGTEAFVRQSIELARRSRK